MEKQLIAIVDNDGVLRREGQQLSGVPELYAEFERLQIRNVILSNNSRVTSQGILGQMQRLGVDNFTQNQAMTSAEAAAEYFAQRRQAGEEDRVFAIGEQGLWDALKTVDIDPVNTAWDGKKWINALPTHVVKGFKTSPFDYYKEQAPAWNALQQGAELISTNGDTSYRNSEKLLLPANGPQVRMFADVAPSPLVMGKPEIGMAEVAVGRFGFSKETARVIMFGDTLEQDAQLVANLQEAGWDAEMWMMLTGETNRDQAEQDDRVHRIFKSIVEAREELKNVV